MPTGEGELVGGEGTHSHARLLIRRQVLRSEKAKQWRVFVHASDRVDRKVAWASWGGERKAWQRALDIIDEGMKK